MAMKLLSLLPLNQFLGGDLSNQTSTPAPKINSIRSDWVIIVAAAFTAFPILRNIE